ncbi:MAG TPA: dockerin type I domain-containing protein [Pirellulales bacterium]|jgi:hypothetical protein|nr:dockerin type I domain-containing protein [Pirellulales bacterium]
MHPKLGILSCLFLGYALAGTVYADVDAPTTIFPAGWTTVGDLDPPTFTTGFGDHLVDNPWISSGGSIGLQKHCVYFDSALYSPLLTFSDSTTLVSFSYSIADDHPGGEEFDADIFQVSGSDKVQGDHRVITYGTTASSDGEIEFDVTPGDTYQIRFRAYDYDTVASISSLGMTGPIQITNASVVYLPGDFNHDGHIDSSDILPMMKALVDPAGYQSQYHVSADVLAEIGDINQDGSFNNADLQSFLDFLNYGDGSATAVPEPNSSVLSILIAIGVFAGKRKRQTATAKKMATTKYQIVAFV